MKRLKQHGTTLIVFIIMALIGIGFTAWQVAKNSSPQPSADSSNDCDTDRQCFYQAFTDCSQKTLKTTLTTVEGGIITTIAKIAQDRQNCRVEVIVDGSRDAFGGGKVRTYTCEKLTHSETYSLTASECTGDTSSLNI